jgi:hypothetical protein
VVVESGTVLLVSPAPTRRAPILAFARRGDLLLPPLDDEALVGLGRGPSASSMLPRLTSCWRSAASPGA